MPRMFVKALVVASLFAMLTVSGVSIHGQGLAYDTGSTDFLDERIRAPWLSQRLPAAVQAAAAFAPPAMKKWQTETIDSSGYAVSMVLDAAGRPHIVYAGGSESQLLWYTYFDGYAWRKEVALPWNGQAIRFHASLALDANENPHVAYCYPSVGMVWECENLVHAYRTGSEWQTEVVDRGYVGVHNSLRIDSMGRIHVAYYDQYNRDLKYAYRDSAGWHIQRVDSTGDVGSNLSMALDASNRPHISYCEGFGETAGYGYCDALKYAFYNGASWDIRTVDSEGYQGIGTSIALDGAGQPHISYCAAFELRYAFRDGQTWKTQTVDDIATETALVLDSAGRPYIIYSSTHNGSRRLKYAQYDGSVWRKSLLEALTYWSPPPYVPLSIAVDKANQLHIAYTGTAQEAFARTVRYARAPTDLGVWTKLTSSSYRDRNWEIYTANGNGSGLTRRTDHGAIDTTPEFNRGANRIVFVSDREGKPEIYTMNADGSNPTRLTWTGSESMPTWSSDGSKIAFCSERDGNAEIYVMDWDGSDQTRLTTNPAWDCHPTWSPDSGIAFISKRGGPYELWTMNANGTNQRRLATGSSTAAYPDWSPDGTRIVFNDDFNSDGWLDIAVVNADGTGLTHPLGGSPSSQDYLSPVWAPNATDLAFARVQWINYQGQWYWMDAYVYGHDLKAGWTYGLIDSGYEWWPDWGTIDVAGPSSQVNSLPNWSSKLTFGVRWAGSDKGPAGIAAYDVQYRDGPQGTWTNWVVKTPQQTAEFTGQDGHAYYFRSRGFDFAQNTEAYPDAADAFTRVDVSAPSSAASSPQYTNVLSFTVTWTGADSGSGVASFDVQYRDGVQGDWINWRANTTPRSATFTGRDGHVYYFRSRARDIVGNLEAYPQTPDTSTLVDVSPPASAVISPEYSITQSFTVTWSGTDSGSGIAAYDIQFRDGSQGLWTDWLVNSALSSAAFAGQDGHLYFFRSRARDRAGNLEAYPQTADASTLVDISPPTSVASSPEYASAPSFMVTWSGQDPGGTGVESYDVQYREGTQGVWTDWLTTTRSTAALFTGLHNHTYDFRSRARDKLGNLEDYPADGDSQTRTPTYQLLGQVLNNRHQPLCGASVNAQPEALGVAYSDPRGRYALYFNSVGDYTLAISHPMFAALPPLYGLPLQDSLSGLEFVLPPLRDAIVNGGWETGDVTGWHDGGGIAPAVSTAAAHTGRFGLAMEASDAAMGLSAWITQEVDIPANCPMPTLSWVYRVERGQPSDTFTIVISDTQTTITHTLPVTPTMGWAHAWYDLSVFAGQSVTLRWELQTQSGEPVIYIDEVSLGTTATGVYPTYAPLLVKNDP